MHILNTLIMIYYGAPKRCSTTTYTDSTDNHSTHFLLIAFAQILWLITALIGGPARPFTPRGYASDKSAKCIRLQELQEIRQDPEDTHQGSRPVNIRNKSTTNEDIRYRTVIRAIGLINN